MWFQLKTFITSKLAVQSVRVHLKGLEGNGNGGVVNKGEAEVTREGTTWFN